MDGLTFRSSMNAARTEPKGANQEVVGGCNVLINEQRDDSFEAWHELLRGCSPASSREHIPADFKCALIVRVWNRANRAHEAASGVPRVSDPRERETRLQ